MPGSALINNQGTHTHFPDMDDRTLTSASPALAPALKELIDEACLRRLAADLVREAPHADIEAFLDVALKDLPTLSIMQRVHRIAESLHVALPGPYEDQLDVVRRLGPRVRGAFVGMGLSDFVATYGRHDAAMSLAALKHLTAFGTSEFAIRHFLRQDLEGTLQAMADWSRDDNEHVRRLASEGCRPRLPWSFRLEALIVDPSPVAPILRQLNADASPYVRRSVANHLNDITKDHPDWVFEHIGTWPADQPATAWIIRHGLRSLVKTGDPRALKALGAADTADVVVDKLSALPASVAIGGNVDIAFSLRSTSAHAQRLVVDYAVHYVKKNGLSSRKVFKLTALTLEAGATASLQTRRAVRNFTTRVHYPGRHQVDILVNGRTLGSTDFLLLPVKFP